MSGYKNEQYMYTSNPNGSDGDVQHSESLALCILFRYSSRLYIHLLHLEINALTSFVLLAATEGVGLKDLT
jgi:hypothetical protein